MSSSEHLPFSLRPWRPTDLESLVRNANNPDIARFMMDQFPYPYTVEKGKAFIEFATSEDPIRIFAIEVDGQAVGGIGLHPQTDIQRKNIELAYWLGQPYWGRGIMASAIGQMVERAFATYDVTRVFARTFGTNTASQRVLEKAGFVLEARFSKTYFKLGEYQDELVYAIRREPKAA